jgi:hypothetical protein
MQLLHSTLPEACESSTILTLTVAWVKVFHQQDYHWTRTKRPDQSPSPHKPLPGLHKPLRPSPTKSLLPHNSWVSTSTLAHTSLTHTKAQRHFRTALRHFLITSMFGGNGGQRRGVFQGGIWGSGNPFRGVGGGGGMRPIQPMRGFGEEYEEEYAYDDGYGTPGPMPMAGGMRSTGYIHGQMPTIMGGTSMGSMGMGGMGSNAYPYGGGMGGSAPMPMSGGMLNEDTRLPVNGRNNNRNQGSQPDPRFSTELEPGPLPHDRPPTQDTAETMAEFMQRHTQPISESGANAPPNDDCPICLEPPSAEHLCVQIKDIPGCNHMIGRECLKEMLTRRPDDKKECPLCRATFLAEDGIWQDPAAFDLLANDIGGHGHQPSPDYRFSIGYAGPRRGTLADFGGTPYAAAPRNANMGGVGNDRGMGDLDYSGAQQQQDAMTGGMGQGDYGGRHMPDMGPSNHFDSGGQRFSGGHQPDYQHDYYTPQGGGMGYDGGSRGGQRRGGAFQGGIWGAGNPFR